MSEQRKAVTEAMVKQAQKKRPQVLRGINAEPVPNKRPALIHRPSSMVVRG